MPAQTPVYKLPYPTAGDPVWQGATQIQALANRLEAVLQAAGIPAPQGLAAAMIADESEKA